MDFADTITLKGLEWLTDDEFFDFCQKNRDLRLERNARKEIIIMRPRGTRSGLLTSKVSGQLFQWKLQNQTGHTFSSTTGFTLPDGSVFSPDASWVSNEKWDALSPEQRKKFGPVCPEFIVEVKSPSDRLPTVQAKMEVWMSNGCQLAWLIHPELETVFIYRADGSRDELHGFDRRVSGEDVLPGFELELEALR